MLQKIKERDITIKVNTGKISKKLDVFYNPVMKLNRDISILLLEAIDKKQMQIALPLAGSGVRGVRFLKELNKNKIKKVYFNDYSKQAIKRIKENLKLNKIKSKFQITSKDADLFLLQEKGFDYIDIDPFGTPNPFLDSAIKRLARDGVLAVTATDTSSLCGTHPKTCERKYWATPLHSSEMQEIGLRILIRKIQLIGAQYEKALTPIFSYSKEHYMRTFLRCEKEKKKVDEIIKLHGYYKNSGPTWLGNLIDKKLANKMSKINKEQENKKFLDTIREELNITGFYDIHNFCKKNKLKIPKKDKLIKTLKKKGYKTTLTHFLDTAIKSNIKKKELIKIIKREVR